MKAAESGNMDNSIRLIQAGCNPFIRDYMNNTAIEHAQHNPSSEIDVMIQQYVDHCIQSS